MIDLFFIPLIFFQSFDDVTFVGAGLYVCLAHISLCIPVSGMPTPVVTRDFRF
jgi:hypothetical protein